jgi:hypothetical protein
LPKVALNRLAKIYFALMVVVCAAVVAGPASSGTISNLSIHGTGHCDIINFTVNSDTYKEFTGSTWDNSVVYNGTLSAAGDGLVKLGPFNATCTLTSQDCSFGLRFNFDGTGFSDQVTFGLSMVGTATDYTRGTLELVVVHNEMIAASDSLDFSRSDGGGINVGPVTLVANLPGGAEDPLGKFQGQVLLNVVDLVKGASMSLPGNSADITYRDTEDPGGVPEPGSALLLLGGFAMMEFLRRKVRG